MSFRVVNQYYLLFIYLFLINILVGCSDGGTPRTNNPGTPVSLGTLPNGSQVLASQGNFLVPSNGQAVTGALFLTGGQPGYTGTITTSMQNGNANLKLKAVDLTPTVTLSPTPCILVAGSSTQYSCQIQIIIAATVPNGTYVVTPTYTPQSGGKPILLGNFTVTVTANNPPSPGDISIVANSNTLAINESTTAILTLSGSTGVSNLVVNVSSKISGIVKINPSSCTLSSEVNSCSINIIGAESGSTFIVASGNGYVASTNEISVTSAPPPTPGTLSLNLNPESIESGNIATATVTLNGASGINNLSINLSTGAPGDTGTAHLNSASCTIANSSSNNTCSVTLTGESVGIVTVVASSSGYTNTQSVLTINPTPSSAKSITSFSIESIAGTIIGQNITESLPFNTNESSLVATFTTTGMSVTVNNIPQVSGVTVNNFTSPLIYTVIAEDGSTESYTVTVTILPQERKIMFVSTGVYTGDLQNGGGSVGIPGIPAQNGLLGADAICQQEAIESNLPGTYKALLNNNSATKVGVLYLKADLTTRLAVSTTNYLVAFESSLENEPGYPNGASVGGGEAWTGFTPSMDIGYTGWSAYPSGSAANACSNWNSDSSNESGVAGRPFDAPANEGGRWSTVSPQAGGNQNWQVEGRRPNTCNNPAHLYCVQQ